MPQGLLQCASVLSLFAMDWALALACGLLLAGEWKRRHAGASAHLELSLPGMPPVAAVIVVALCAHFYLLAATMIENASFASVFAAVPGVALTHAGSVTLWALFAACLLLAANFLFGACVAVRSLCISALLATILLLHAAMGHAAGRGDFTLHELLQFLHLAGMALWSGSVLVAGLFVAPQMFAATSRIDPDYLRALSRVSAWSVALAVVTGAIRGWTGLDAHLGNLAQSGWGRILTLKLLFVCAALALGYMHRRDLRARGDDWTTAQCKRLLATLRIEATCLTVVLLLSAWLASADLPGG